MKKVVFKATLQKGPSLAACDFIAAKTGLSKMRVKDAMNKGAAWLKRGKAGQRRLRKAKAILVSGDHVEFYYDERILSVVPSAAECVADMKQYSVWYKPSGVMAQGTMYGDHCSLTRQAELHFGLRRDVYLVHRLDREVSGLMILAHTGKAAAKLSDLFRRDLVQKTYLAEVLGNLLERGERGTIGLPLDGKPSSTEYRVRSYDPRTNTSAVEVRIHTGRLHQIRRHFEMIGFPVMGDPRYGRGNKNREGLRLTAISLRFHCPFLDDEVFFELPASIDRTCDG